jgi:hypothetical protein
MFVKQKRTREDEERYAKWGTGCATIFLLLTLPLIGYGCYAWTNIGKNMIAHAELFALFYAPSALGDEYMGIASMAGKACDNPGLDDTPFSKLYVERVATYEKSWYELGSRDGETSWHASPANLPHTLREARQNETFCPKE